MVRQRRNIQSKKQLSSKKISNRHKRKVRQPSTLTSPSSSSSMVKQNSSEYLDDETKLAKRHLTKEMWQLVSIAVKRMADELVALSNNQQTTTTNGPNNSQSILNETNQSTIQQPIMTNTGAGDEPLVKEKSIIGKESIKNRTLPLEMLEPSIDNKKKEISNNATRRSTKSKIQRKPSKNNSKIITQRLQNKYKSK